MLNEKILDEVKRVLGNIIHAQKMSNKYVEDYMETGNRESYQEWKSFQSYAVGQGNKVQGIFYAVEAIEGIVLRYFLNDKRMVLYADDKEIWSKAVWCIELILKILQIR